METNSTRELMNGVSATRSMIKVRRTWRSEPLLAVVTVF